MKIRIQDHSVRFRISLQEAKILLREGRIESRTETFSKIAKQCSGRFAYGIKRLENELESRCEILPGSIWILLSQRDCQRLNDPTIEGIYLQEETELDKGTVHRFMAFVEKDRPSTKCDKPELWIYDHRSNATIPILKPEEVDAQ
ncbi:MAG: hypothetical protein AB1656_00270 [Candidatus Omnitrophota bacterium]